MERADDFCDFQASELGTKQYWEDAYNRELTVFHDIGDPGEVWFGEDSQERVVDWIEECDAVTTQDAVIDLGCGNGAMLLELRQHGFTNLTGVDYVEKAINLAQAVLAKAGFEDVKLETGDLTSDLTSLPPTSALRQHYKVCVDKGTYDAISLTSEGAAEARLAYKRSVRCLLEQDGLFIITSCNWTKDQLVDFFQSDFKLTDELRTPSFQFGGKVGRTVTSLVFSPLPS